MKPIKRFAGIGTRPGKLPDDIAVLQVGASFILTHVCGFLGESGEALGSDRNFLLGSKQGCFRIHESRRGASKMPEGVYTDGKAILNESHRLIVDSGVATLKEFRGFKESTRLLWQRNPFQVLGPDLKDPVNFVLCHTPDGCISHETYQRGLTGGTGVAIAIASRHNIPVFNTQRDDHRERIHRLVNKYLNFDTRMQLTILQHLRAHAPVARKRELITTFLMNQLEMNKDAEVHQSLSMS
ncbi:hypothetical protein [Neptuniibacter sp. QD37_11]|uniref:hypothetical protein n=1 Tax=Neptuniibacter sp. QD37_11 TaxID=3398209 RepID=UPI0039F5EB26